MRTTRRNGSVLPLGCFALSVLALGACHKYSDDALTAVRANSGDIKACIDEAAQRNPQLKGRMELLLEIAPNGKVNRLGFSKDEAKDPQLADCVKQRAQNWQLPPPPSGKNEEFTYKFNVGVVQ